MVYADEELVREIDVNPLGICYGRKVSVTNIWVPQISVDKFTFALEYEGEELDKSDNEIVLESKK